MQISESAPKVEGTEYCSGFYREAGFYDAHSLPDTARSHR